MTNEIRLTFGVNKDMEKLSSKIKRYKHLLAYAITGGLTTILNLICYFILASRIHYVIANVIAWVICLFFSFFTNKAFVFENSGWRFRESIREFWRFFLSSAASGVIDVAFLFFLVDIAGCNEAISKLADTVLIIVLNYLIRRFWVFQGQKKGEDPCT